MAVSLESCEFHELTEELLSTYESFSCGNDDLDDFFRTDATRYSYFLMGKTYCFCSGNQIVCAFTVSNDSIRIYDLPRSRRDFMKRITHHEKPLRRYPGVLIGRLGVNTAFARQGIGSELLAFIKGWFFARNTKTGCRFLIVDAVNSPHVLAFYQHNGFLPLFSSEEQEFLYMGGKKDEFTALETRLMYFDLLKLREEGL